VQRSFGSCPIRSRLHYPLVWQAVGLSLLRYPSRILKAGERFHPYAVLVCGLVDQPHNQPHYPVYPIADNEALQGSRLSMECQSLNYSG